MNNKFLAAAAAAVVAAGTGGAIVALRPASSAQTPTNPPVSSVEVPDKGGIIISVSGSATLSTKGIPPGGEIWAEWYSLPPGQALEDTTSASKWAYLEMALDGSAIVNGGATPKCSSFVSGPVPPGADRVAEAGDLEACNYAVLPGSRTENRGSVPYIVADLSVGGPADEEAEDTNKFAKVGHVGSDEFRNVEQELRAAGAMRLAIRTIDIPPGARMVTTDHYPTVRMVQSGQLTLTSAGVAPQVFKPSDMMAWSPANAQRQIVLSNGGKVSVELVEWTVAPAQAATP